MTQIDLFTPADRARLGKQLVKVRDWMATRQDWVTLRDISNATGAPEASASARLRELHALGYTVQKRRAHPGSGTWLYRVVFPGMEDTRRARQELAAPKPEPKP